MLAFAAKTACWREGVFSESSLRCPHTPCKGKSSSQKRKQQILECLHKIAKELQTAVI